LKHKRSVARYAIIGTGLIGTSIGMALRQGVRAPSVVGYDRSTKTARMAMRKGALTSVASSMTQAIAKAQIVVIAVPRRHVGTLLTKVLKGLQPGTLVIDVAGLKADLVAASQRVRTRTGIASFIGGHPMAGNEGSGPGFARGDLFTGQTFALCPPQSHNALALSQAKAFVRALGARPVQISARDHDRVVAATSALPQVVSSAAAWAAEHIAGEHAEIAGPGLSGVIRLAASPAELWADDLIANKRNVLQALNVFETRLRGFRRAIAAGERMRLRRLLRAGAVAQRRLSPRRQVFLSRAE
jgi:prephenate dehydrogenase